MSDFKQYQQYLKDVCAVKSGDKPLVIVSSGKSLRAYESCTLIAEQLGINHEHAMLRCEDGCLHEMVFIGRGTNARQATDLILGAKEGEITRPMLQFELGRLLGYSEEMRLNFVASAAGRNCPCDCCGGPFVDERFFDDSMRVDQMSKHSGVVDLVDGEGV
jgi:hypothetical protein